MNYRRLAAAALAAWIVSIPVGYFVNEVLLAGYFEPNLRVMRQETELTGLLPLGFAFLLLGFVAFAYAYAKGYEGGSGVMEGIRYGVVVAVILSCFGLIWQYILFPITGAMAAATILDSVVELALYGAIVGAIYKPAAAPRQA
jgi:hypothetical protein